MEQTRQATILVVDDDERNRKLLEALLAAEGHAVRSAASGEEALAAVAQQLPDLILLDIMMPGIDGFEVARRLKADTRTNGRWRSSPWAMDVPCRHISTRRYWRHSRPVQTLFARFTPPMRIDWRILCRSDVVFTGQALITTLLFQPAHSIGLQDVELSRKLA